MLVATSSCKATHCDFSGQFIQAYITEYPPTVCLTSICSHPPSINFRFRYVNIKLHLLNPTQSQSCSATIVKVPRSVDKLEEHHTSHRPDERRHILFYSLQHLNSSFTHQVHSHTAWTRLRRNCFPDSSPLQANVSWQKTEDNPQISCYAVRILQGIHMVNLLKTNPHLFVVSE
jgi:hypothetical protein